LDQKLQFTFSQAAQAIGEAFNPQKRTSNTSYGCGSESTALRLAEGDVTIAHKEKLLESFEIEP
jgi:hypothetical protein